MSRAPWKESHTPISDEGLNVAAALIELRQRHHRQQIRLADEQYREIVEWQRRYGRWLEERVRPLEKLRKQPTPIAGRIAAKKQAATGGDPEAA